MKKLLKQCVFVYFAFLTAALYAQTFSVVYNFGSQPNDPDEPTDAGIIAQGRDGNLYSGAWGGSYNEGATFKVTPAGELTTLYSFTNATDGSLPYGGLTLGTDGNFFGAAYSANIGGGAPYGTVFKMTPTGKLTTLYTFTNGSDGSLPMAPPIQGVDGNFYGTTCPPCGLNNGPGSIYKITSSGAFSVLHTCGPNDCYGPGAPLIQGTDGSFYGASYFGGTTGGGSIFKITPEGKIAVLYDFVIIGNESAPYGEAPNGPLVQGTDGNFYGTTGGGGLKFPGCGGVLFRITSQGKLTVLHKMNCAKESGNPTAGLIQATDGNFYGVNSGHSSLEHPCGTLFKITPAGVFTVLHWFDSTGCAPFSNLVQHTNGLIYGMTQAGGTGNDSNCGQSCGVLYSLDIGAAPFVTFVGQPAGQAGKTVEILGQGFTGATAVSFNGTPATFKVVSDTYLLASVPTGAANGTVTVTTPTGALMSNRSFSVLP